MTPITITIDDQRHPITDDDQEAAALIRLAGRDPKFFDLFGVKKGIEERIRDNQIVNLKDGQHFATRHKVRFKIDGEPFQSFDDDQTAAALLRLAGLNPDEFDLARVIGAAGTYSGDTVVVISDGDEFVTAKRVGPVA
ncbi:MAG: hypothetical protein HGA44_00140 [Cellulomonadaceae bacterium]|nr:hypothetical protein [Cellulomonadaceae bacterium]